MCSTQHSIKLSILLTSVKIGSIGDKTGGDAFTNNAWRSKIAVGDSVESKNDGHFLVFLKIGVLKIGAASSILHSRFWRIKNKITEYQYLYIYIYI